MRKDVFPAQGTTRFFIGDPWYEEQLQSGAQSVPKELYDTLVYDGKIKNAPLGSLTISEMEDEDYGFSFLRVDVVQASTPQILRDYEEGYYYPKAVSKEIQLGCDTAEFKIVTDSGCDYFRTGADGYFGTLLVMKEKYGMKLQMDLAPDMFSYEELVKRMLALFPERKIA